MAVDSGTVLEVAADSPAARAGVATGDVIASANGEAVHHGEDLRSIVSRLHPGSEIVLQPGAVGDAHGVAGAPVGRG